ncbi:hypothetical protein C8A05DRAFT_43299 [Staphylotrichum tortipilum]|uniref:Aminomethyltransferase n=1 Tax=Staphylotrichum tortipilum TaxID=2831512 RepID=A0AAN6MP71_9PEZI|nr:hypothetical protein C8A05DRAFT_43299 [Staphylotrichum longicolle]
MQASRSTSLARALRGACRTPARTVAARSLTSRAAPAISTTRPSVFPQHHHHHHHHHPLSSTLQTRHASSSSSTPSAPLQKTPLYPLHLAHAAKMVPFGGFHMPVQYASLSVAQSHLFTRSHASIFDVGHMVQRIFSGPGAGKFLERVTPAGLVSGEALGEHRSTLSVLMKEDGSGGVVDDTIVTKLAGGRFYVVTNAGCREKDDEYFDREVAKWNGEQGPEGAVKEERLHGQGLVALQGPAATEILAAALGEEETLDLKGLLFGQSAYARVQLPGGRQLSKPVLISRGGYTGEDGFEISIAGDETVAVTEALLAAGGPEKVQLAGLGARDSLRLEAGMCLYGHDLDEATSPVEAGLAWVVPKHRRGADAGYYGAAVVAGQIVPKSKGGAGITRRRVGLIVEGAPAREGAEIVARDGGEKLGTVTSGCPSPSLGKNVAMGYVRDGFHKVGTEVDVLVRGRPRKAVVVKMPFVPTKYWKGEA